MEPIPAHLNIMFSPKYAVPVFGFAVPILAIIVFLVNCLMIWTLLRPNMRSPINAILISIAISDTLAIVLPLPPFVYFYTLGNYRDFVPFGWCRTFFSMVHVFPLLCNMASLWTTVFLACMRCYSVWKPLRARVVFTTARTYVVIFAIYIASTATYFPLIFEYSFNQLSTESMVMSNSTILTCHMQKSQSHSSLTFCAVHTWVQITMTSLLPWFLILFPDVGLLWKLKKANNNRLLLQGGRGKSNDASVSRTRMTTWLIFFVVSMIWLVEIPFAISFTRQLSHTNGDVMRKSIGDSVVFVFLLKYTTYPVIFLAYCFMSQRFRQTFKDAILCRVSRNFTSRSNNTMTGNSEENKTSV